MTTNFNSSNISRYSIWWRRLIHRPLAALVRLTLPCKVRLFRSDYVPNGKPTVFVATHVFYDDIAAVLSCLDDVAYLLIENDGKESLPAWTERFALGMNGVITVDRSNKESRAEAFSKMITVLNRSGNILLFPEAAWNFSQNEIVAKLHWGAIKLAKSANANIVPVALHMVGDECFVAIGSQVEYDVEALRDAMATLMWDLISQDPLVQRENITDEYWLEHICKQCEKRPQESREVEESFMYRPKGEISLGEVLAEMYGIEHKSMAADYVQYRRIEGLIDGWTKPVSFNYKNQNVGKQV